MGNRTAKFISALVGSIIVGAPLAAISQTTPTATTAANAGDDCLASPKGAAPQGQHWFYRLERGTKRQCWYLRAEGGRESVKETAKETAKDNVSKPSARPVQTAQAGGETPAPAAAPPQSVQNARAEYVPPQTSSVTSAPPAPPAAVESAAPAPAVATRWPDTAPAPDSAAPPPPPQAATPQPAAKPARSSSAVTLAAADSSTDKPAGSLPILVLVIGGALALAGLLASVTYRFAGSRVRVQAGDNRRVNWDNREPRDADDDRAPWLAAAAVTRAQPPRPIDFDAMRPHAAGLAGFEEIDRSVARVRGASDAPDARDETERDAFQGESEIEAAVPQPGADDAMEKAPSEHDDEVRTAESVDIDVITAMLERLAQDGPRLTPPSPEADLAGSARSPRGQSAARA